MMIKCHALRSLAFYLAAAALWAGFSGGGSSPPPHSQPTATPTPAATATPTLTPSPSPTPAPTLSGVNLFVATGTTGVQVYSAAGTLVDTFATSTGAQSVIVDAAGQVDVGTGVSCELHPNAAVVAEYAIGAANPATTVIPCGEVYPNIADLQGNAAGTIVVGEFNPATEYLTYFVSQADGSNPSQITKGLGVTYTTFVPMAAIAQDGTVAVANGVTTPNGTQFPASNAEISVGGTNYTLPGQSSPNVLAFGPDDTLYAGQVSASPAPGLYVLESGQQSVIGQGTLNPVGVGFDSLGNVYVLSPTNLTVYAAGTLTQQRSISNGISNASSLAVAPDGTAYVLEPTGIQVVGPTGTSATQFVAGTTFQSIAIFDASGATPNKKLKRATSAR